jgi:hypothetical protein
MFTPHGTTYRRFSPIRSRRNHYDYLPHGFVTIAQLPILACPCDVIASDVVLRRPRHLHSRAHVPSVTVLPSIPDFPAYLLRLPHWERYLLEHVSSDLAFEDIFAFLLEYGGVGVSDGSSARHLGSFGWALATPEGQRLAKCSGLVHGDDPSSFRSEATGLLAVLLFLLHLRIFFDVTVDCRVTLYTDNKGLVVVIPEITKLFQSSLVSFRADWDLLQAITSTIQQISSLPIHVHHVKGHQDCSRDVASLSLLAQPNVEAYELATDFNAPLTTSLPETPFNPTTKIQLVVGRKTVTGHLRSRLRYQLHYQPLADLIRLRYKWTLTILWSVDLKSSGLIYRSVYDHRTSVTKFIQEQLPTGSRLSK